MPNDAVSGVYIAHLVNNVNPDIESHITFVVRDDASDSDIVLQTNDTTWQAYNQYGGNSLYRCGADVCPTGNPSGYKAAYSVSYNRPLQTERDSQYSALFGGAEYGMIRFLEASGYDLSYMSGVDVHARGQLLQNHKLFISNGHDEYWSGAQFANMTAARDAGVNLAFFSGNTGFWRTRFEPSIAGPSTANRTLTSYKDTHFDVQQDPATWTGTWRDPRSQPSENIKPENSLIGTSFLVNSGTTHIVVPPAFRQLRLWRNTGAGLAANQNMDLAPETLGYEWDVDADNGFRPAGLARMSSTTASGLEVFLDWGTTTMFNGTATHNLTMYKAPSGARVFSAATVQWSRGLDNYHPDGNVDNNMRQATVNLFADMGVQPRTLLSGLVAASASTDTTAPTTTVTPPPASVQDGSQMTIMRHGDRRRRRPRRRRGGLDGRRHELASGERHHELVLHVDGARQPVDDDPSPGRRRQRQPRRRDRRRQRERELPVLAVGHEHGGAGQGRGLRRPGRRRGRRQVHLREVRDRLGHPLLQGGDQHGHAHRQPVDGVRRADRAWPPSRARRAPAGRP